MPGAAGIPYRVTVEFEPAPDVTVRVHREGMRRGHRKAGRDWHAQKLPNHFRPRAVSRYRMRPRKRSYKENKRDAVASGVAVAAVPLVFKGDLREMSLAFARVQGFPTRGRVTLTVPKYVVRRRKPGGVDLQRDLTALARDEMPWFSGKVADTASDYFNRNARQRRRRVNP